MVRTPQEALRRCDTDLARLASSIGLLARLTPKNAVEERQRLLCDLRSGRKPVPSWQLERRGTHGAFRTLDRARHEARALPGAQLYLDKLDELELELALVDAIGDGRRVRRLAARRFGTGAEQVNTVAGPISLATLARRLLDEVPVASRSSSSGGARAATVSVAAAVRELARVAGLAVQVRMEPRLAAGAATGNGVIYVGSRAFEPREALRIAVHEVFGHLVAAANGRAQTMRLLEIGTAGSFTDQEGVALCCEEAAGLIDSRRLRTLAARVLATDWMHAGACFGDTAQRLHREEHFPATDAIVISERVYRGGGVARDAAYLLGWLRVRDALRKGRASLDELRAGRVSLAAIPALRELADRGWVRPPVYRPNLERSLRATPWGTIPCTSPPSEAASLTKLELT